MSLRLNQYILPVILAMSTLGFSAFGQTVDGSVTDTAGRAVANAKVEIIESGHQTVHAATDANGEFRFSSTPAGAPILRVSADGYAVCEKPLAQIARPIVIVMQPSALREDVTVSITRTGSRLAETPASVVVLDRQTMDATAAQTVDDTLRQVPGFTLFRRSSSKNANPTTQGANLRGIGGSGAARTAVLFDGVSLSDAFGGWTYWSRIPPIAIDRIEVLRGGASSLYGTSALSGAIGLEPTDVHKKALRFETSAGTQGTFEGELFGAYAFRNWDLETAVDSFQTAGYIPTASDQRGRVDTRAGGRHHSGIFTLGRTLRPGTRVFSRANVFEERRDNGTSLTNNRTYFRQLSAGLDSSSVRFGTVQARASVDSQVYDQTFSSVSTDRNTENLTRIQRVPSWSGAASVSWMRPVGDHTFSASADMRLVRGFSDETAVSAGRATARISSGGREFSLGVSMQDLWQVMPRLNVSVGVRLDHWHEFDALSSTRSLNGGQPSMTDFPDRTERRVSPRVAALYLLSRNFSLYTSIGTSFRAPTLNELYRAFRVGNVLTLANEGLRAEHARNFEGGASFVGFSHRVSIRANAFLTDVVDPVISVTLAATPSLITRQRQNLGAARTRGFELDAEYSPAARLRFSAGYLFADSRISRAPGSVSLVGLFVPQVARDQFTFQARYQANGRLAVSLQGRASSSQFDDDQNVFRLRPYATVDAFVSYSFRRGFEIFAAAENISDSRYDIGLTPNRTIAAPRSVRVGLRFDLSKYSH